MEIQSFNSIRKIIDESDASDEEFSEKVLDL